jgi:hypothetical protein
MEKVRFAAVVVGSIFVGVEVWKFFKKRFHNNPPRKYETS